MGGWTGIGKDRISWKGRIEQTELTPVKGNDLVTKYYVDNKEVESFPTSLTAGSVVFSDGTNLAESNPNFFWDNVNKRLGVGTTSPAVRIEAESAGVTKIQATSTGSFNAEINMINSVGSWAQGALATSGSWRLRDQTNGASVITAELGAEESNLYINSSGDIGIGTNSPSAKLEVSAAEPIIRLEASGDSRYYTKLKQKRADDGFTIDCGGTKILQTKGYFDADTMSLGVKDFEETIHINTSGQVGIGTTTPTQPLSVNEKVCMTAIGGFAIKLTNKTGANSVAGNLVKADTANNDAIILSAAADTETIGVFLDDGVSDGSEAWVVVSGIADVALDDNVAAVRGNWMGTGVLAGYAATGASPPAAPTHFEEIGHCIESVAATGGGTHIKARCVLHFN